MRDQATSLRMKLLNTQNEIARSAAIISGKGGVGKSNFTANFAYSLRKENQRVLIIDMDIGMGNIHILLGSTPNFSLKDYLNGERDIHEVITPVEDGIAFIAGGSGLESLVEWSEPLFNRLIQGFSVLQTEYDVILFDMGAGATKNSIDLVLAVDEIILVATPEPTSITDAYSMMKYICMQDANKKFHIVSNRVMNEDEGRDSAIRLKLVMRKFLSVETNILGFLPDDPNVRKAVIAQTAFVKMYPDSKVSKRMNEIAKTFLLGEKLDTSIETSGFLNKIKSIFQKGRGSFDN